MIAYQARRQCRAEEAERRLAVLGRREVRRSRQKAVEAWHLGNAFKASLDIGGAPRRVRVRGHETFTGNSEDKHLYKRVRNSKEGLKPKPNPVVSPPFESRLVKFGGGWSK